MYLHKTPWLLRKLNPKLIWEQHSTGKEIFVTFDDGPIPEVTEFVLDNLESVQAKATFFCVGDNIQKNPKIFAQVINHGHSIGNHTFNHLNGFKYRSEDYIQNIEKCETVIQTLYSGRKFFRPPYGRITRKQIDALTPEYKIVMWDVLSGDFDKSLSPEKCLRAAIKYTQPGSILIFHDSIKAYPNLKYALPRYLNHFKEKGFIFNKL